VPGTVLHGHHKWPAARAGCRDAPYGDPLCRPARSPVRCPEHQEASP